MASRILASPARLKNPTIVNLTSQEYWAALDEKALRAPVVHVVFKEIKGGKASVVSFLAKKARGMLARHIVQHRLTEANDLKSFDTAGYRFDQQRSSDSAWVFSRTAKSSGQ